MFHIFVECKQVPNYRNTLYEAAVGEDARLLNFASLFLPFGDSSSRPGAVSGHVARKQSYNAIGTFKCLQGLTEYLVLE